MLTEAPFRLDGKTAIITGAGSGIGAAIARRFAAQGAMVAIVDMNAAQGDAVASEIVAAGGQARAFQIDVTDQRDVDAAFDTIAAAHGGIHVVVNCAGISHIGTIEQTPADAMERLFRVNVMGVYHGLQAAIRHMKPAGVGSIVNLASIASMIGVADRFAYSMTKGAVLTMTKSVAIDYVAMGIRCNCICPARIHTPFVDGFLTANYPGREAEMFAQLSAYQPVGRMGTPEEVAALALYLAADESAFVTGQAFPLDGGVLR